MLAENSITDNNRKLAESIEMALLQSRPHSALLQSKPQTPLALVQSKPQTPLALLQSKLQTPLPQ